MRCCATAENQPIRASPDSRASTAPSGRGKYRSVNGSTARVCSSSTSSSAPATSSRASARDIPQFVSGLPPARMSHVATITFRRRLRLLRWLLNISIPVGARCCRSAAKASRRSCASAFGKKRKAVITSNRRFPMVLSRVMSVSISSTSLTVSRATLSIDADTSTPVADPAMGETNANSLPVPQAKSRYAGIPRGNRFLTMRRTSLRSRRHTIARCGMVKKDA